MLLDRYVLNELHLLESKNILRQLYSTQKVGNSIVYQNSKPYISFSCNDYFCLSNNPIVKQSAVAAIQKYGLGSGSSRLIAGNHELYRILEEKLAKRNDQESSIVFSSGYMANIGSISAIMSRYDLIVADKLVHSSLIDGATLSQARFIRFRHNDINHCEKLLKENRHLYRNCLILADHVYSMDGDVAPVKELVRIAKQYNCWSMIDDAHGFGIVPMNCKPDIYVGTLSKALGSLGGYIASSSNVVKYLYNKSRPFIYTTALPISVIAGAIVAIDIVKNSPDNLIEKAQYFCQELGLPEPKSNIVTINIDRTQETLIQHRLTQAGFLVKIIKPPTVPTMRLRFSFTVAHKRNDIKRLCQVLRLLG